MTRDPRELAGAWTAFQHHDYPSVSRDLREYVAAHWHVTWRYERPYRQLVVPYPHVHLTLRRDTADDVLDAVVTGVATRHQVRVLEGEGSIFGVAFRPGVFRALLDGPVRLLTDRRLDARGFFGPDLPQQGDVDCVEAWLRARLPPLHARAAQAVAAVDLIMAHPELTRVDDLSKHLGCSVRQVQRLFAEHVGVPPKWVIRRYRLHEITQRLAAGLAVDWADVAHELGFTDQAHLSRDFAKIFGEPPTYYARRYASPGPSSAERRYRRLDLAGGRPIDVPPQTG